MRSILALVLFGSASCAFFDDDSGDGQWVSIEEYGAAFKDAHCTYLARCGHFPDKASCLAAEISIAISVDANAIAAVASGRVIYNGSNVRACLDAMAGNTCDRTDENGRVTPQACLEIIRGTRASGEDCFDDAECISQNCIGGSTNNSCSLGQCVGDTPPVTTKAQIGEQCLSQSGCVANAYCDTTVDLCAALKSDGMACQQASECAYGLGCAGATGTRTCKALPTEGQMCPDSVCRDDGLVCNSTTMTCQKIGLPSATCTSSTQCSQYYPCNFTTGQCTKGPTTGMPCSGSSRCFDAGTFCDTLAAMPVCTAKRADGQMCTSDPQCASDNCDPNFQMCATPPVCY